eukprot:scaffold24204_cov57-Attheya_sp.AAC.2
MIRVNGAVALLLAAIIGIWTCRFRRSAIGVTAFSSSYNIQSSHHGISHLPTQRRKMLSSSLFQSKEDGEENGLGTTNGMSTATVTVNMAVENNNNNNLANINNRQRNKDWIHDDICRVLQICHENRGEPCKRALHRAEQMVYRMERDAHQTVPLKTVGRLLETHAAQSPPNAVAMDSLLQLILTMTTPPRPSEHDDAANSPRGIVNATWCNWVLQAHAITDHHAPRASELLQQLVHHASPTVPNAQSFSLVISAWTRPQTSAPAPSSSIVSSSPSPPPNNNTTVEDTNNEYVAVHTAQDWLVKFLRYSKKENPKQTETVRLLMRAWETVICTWANHHPSKRRGGDAVGARQADTLLRQYQEFVSHQPTALRSPQSDPKALTDSAQYAYTSVVCALCGTTKTNNKQASSQQQQVMVRRAHELFQVVLKSHVHKLSLSTSDSTANSKDGANTQSIMTRTLSPPPLVIWNTLLTAWSKSLDPVAPQKALYLLELAQHLQSDDTWKPDIITYNAALDALVRNIRTVRRPPHHGNGDTESVRSPAQEAMRILNHMQTSTDRKTPKPDIITYSTLLFAFGKETGMSEYAKEVLEGMIRAGNDDPTNDNKVANSIRIRPGIEHYSAVLSSLARDGKAREAHALLDTMQTQSLQPQQPGQKAHYLRPDVPAYSTVMHAYAKSRNDPQADIRACSLLKHTMQLYQTCRSTSDDGADNEECPFEKPSQYIPSGRTFFAAISALANVRRQGNARRAHTILQHMKKFQKEEPEMCNEQSNAYIYNAVMNCCTNTMEPEDKKEAFQLAARCFQELKQQQQADTFTYTYFLRAIRVLLPHDSDVAQQKQGLLTSTFAQCCQAGLVNEFVLNRFLQASTPATRQTAFFQQAQEAQITKNFQEWTVKELPTKWTKNVPKRNYKR